MILTCVFLFQLEAFSLLILQTMHKLAPDSGSYSYVVRHQLWKFGILLEGTSFPKASYLAWFLAWKLRVEMLVVIEVLMINYW